MNRKMPPEPLIRTWVWMAYQSPEPEIRKQGKRNLVNAFGSIEKAIKHIESVLGEQ